MMSELFWLKRGGISYGYYKLLKKLGLSANVSLLKKLNDYYIKLPSEQYPNEVNEFIKMRKLDFSLTDADTYNQKMWVIKAYDDNTLKTKLADKYDVREWISEQIGSKYLVPLVGGPWNSLVDVTLGNLPNSFVLKATHGSGMNEIIVDKSKVDWDKLIVKTNDWLGTVYGINGFEPQYFHMKPKLIAEEYVSNISNEYQFYCFNGEPKFISVIKEPHGINAKATFDLNWNELDFITSPPKLENSSNLPKPTNFEEMKTIARKLCKPFTQVRIDLMLADGKIKFSEMTFTSAAGNIGWTHSGANKKVGDMLAVDHLYH